MNIIPFEQLLAYCHRLEQSVKAIDKDMPSRWHPIRRAFLKGRIYCLREQAANIRDMMQRTGLTNYYLHKRQKLAKISDAVKQHQKLVQELYDGNPSCQHEFETNSFSGVKCKKCGGWFCY